MSRKNGSYNNYLILNLYLNITVFIRAWYNHVSTIFTNTHYREETVSRVTNTSWQYFITQQSIDYSTLPITSTTKERYLWVWLKSVCKRNNHYISMTSYMFYMYTGGHVRVRLRQNGGKRTKRLTPLRRLGPPPASRALIRKRPHSCVLV